MPLMLTKIFWRNVGPLIERVPFYLFSDGLGSKKEEEQKKKVEFVVSERHETSIPISLLFVRFEWLPAQSDIALCKEYFCAYLYFPLFACAMARVVCFSGNELGGMGVVTYQRRKKLDGMGVVSQFSLICKIYTIDVRRGSSPCAWSIYND